MRAYVPAYEIQASPDLSAALDRMAAEPNEWKPFAGGTDLMVLLEAGKLAHTKYLNIDVYKRQCLIRHTPKRFTRFV